MHGIGVPRNYGDALKWCILADKQGNAIAENEIGIAFDSGWGTSQNDAVAVQWYRKAAEKGNTEAQTALCWHLLGGLGVPRNPQNDRDGMQWCYRADQQGDPIAALNIAISYDQGWGVPQSDAKALQWYRRAASEGNKTAQNRLKYWGERRYQQSVGSAQPSESENDPCDHTCHAQWEATHDLSTGLPRARN